MSKLYEVDLFEGNQLVTFEVEAESEQEATDKAIAFRETRFQQSNSQASLEAEKELAQKKLEEAPTTGEAIGAGLAQSKASIFGGLADTAVGIAQGVADLGGTVDPRLKMFSETLQNTRNQIESNAQQVGIRVQERITGRPLTEAEAQKVALQQSEDLGLARLAAQIGTGGFGGAAAIAAKTLPRMLGVGATQGALGGALLTSARGEGDERVNERLMGLSLGGALGMGAAAVPAVFAGLKNVLGRRIIKSAGGKDALKSKTDLLEDQGIDRYSVGQITGDPNLLRAEQDAAGKISDEMLRSQAQQARTALANKLNVAAPDMVNLTEGSRDILQQGGRIISKAIGKLKGRRNAEFEQGLKALDDMVGGRPVIPSGNSVRVAREVVDEIQAQSPGVPFSPYFKGIVKDLNEAHLAGGMSPSKANSLVLRLNQIKRTGSGVFDTSSPGIAADADMYKGWAQRIAGTMKQGIDDSFDEAVELLDPQGGNLLKTLRNNYGRQSEAINGITQDYLQAFNLNAPPGTVLKRLMEADTASTRNVMAVVESMEGGHEWRRGLVKSLFEDAVNEGSKGAIGFGSKAGDFNLKAFAEGLFKRVEATKLKGIITPAEEANATQALQAIKALFNDMRVATPAGTVKTHLAVAIQDLTINALSRDPGFAGRLIAAGITKGAGADNLFFSKEGVKLLTNLTDHVVSGRKIATPLTTANMAILAAMTGDGAARDTAQEIARENVEQR